MERDKDKSGARKTEWGWDRWVIGHSRNFLRKLFSGFSAKCKSVLLATRRPRRGVPLHDSNYYSAESKVVRPIERTPSTEISRTIVCSWSDVDSKTFIDVGPEFPHSRFIVWKQAKLGLSGWLYPYMCYNCTMIDYLPILFEVINLESGCQLRFSWFLNISYMMNILNNFSLYV